MLLNTLWQNSSQSKLIQCHHRHMPLSTVIYPTIETIWRHSKDILHWPNYWTYVDRDTSGNCWSFRIIVHDERPTRPSMHMPRQGFLEEWRLQWCFTAQQLAYCAVKCICRCTHWKPFDKAQLYFSIKISMCQPEKIAEIRKYNQKYLLVTSKSSN